MRPELETYQLIEHFLQGKLSGEALTSFQLKMETDPAFAEEVSYQKMVNTVVSGASFDQLRSTMSADISTIDKRIQVRNRWIASVSLLILSGTALYFMLNRSDITPVQPPAQQEETLVTGPSASHTVSTGSSAQKNTLPGAVQSSSGIQEEKTGSQQLSSVSASDSVIPATTIQHTAEPHKQQVAEPIVQIEEKINPCEHVSIQAQTETQATCRGENKGSVLVDVQSISGGKQPYIISKDGEKNNYFGDLKAGTHSILIIDAAGCKQSIRVTIKEEVCRLNTFSIMPDAGETWKFTGKENEAFTITIVNRAGQQVYKTALSHGTVEWAGMAQQGEYVEAGLYIYVVEYANGTRENGRITITR